MLSIGIRSGRGFDRDTLRKLIESRGKTYEYDVLVLGGNVGGVECAREAARCGKKVAIVHWRIPTPAEEEGHEPNLAEISEALELDAAAIKERTYRALEAEGKADIINSVRMSKYGVQKVSKVELTSKAEFPQKRPRWSRKVRRNKIDIKNAIANMAAEGVRYMHELAVEEDLESRRKPRRKAPRLSWGRMMDKVQDYVIDRSWSILTDFVRAKISVYRGHPLFVDDHTVKIRIDDGGKRELSAEVVVSAVEVHNAFPEDVIGARDFGINYDDFFRMSNSPGRTLVVGANATGLECAGILATFNFPVLVVYRSKILKDCDREITNMIVDDLSQRGVQFLGQRSLLAIRKTAGGEKVLAEFDGEDDEGASMDEEACSFDTVLFATKEKVDRENAMKAESERLTGKVYTPDEEFCFRSLRVIEDQPGSPAATETYGRMLGASIGGNANDSAFKTLVPNVILTPLEYSYVGASENFGRKRLGESCIETFAGNIDAGELFDENDAPLKEKICYVKVVFVKNKEIIVGVHVLGRDSVRITRKILQHVGEKMVIGNLPEIVRGLRESSQFGEEFDRGGSEGSEL